MTTGYRLQHKPNSDRWTVILHSLRWAAQPASIGFCLALLGFGVANLAAKVTQEPAPVPRFEVDILPLFEKSCLSCHGDETRQGGLSLQTRQGVLQGGESGPALVPHHPQQSLLLTLISSGKMPLGGNRLSDEDIELIRQWIQHGAPATEFELSQATADLAVTEREVMASILGAKCLPCHGRRVREADLDLRTREGLLRGGKSGPAITIGAPDKSLLVQRIEAQEMPPPDLQERFSVRGLTSAELEKLRAWIAAGAVPEQEPPVQVNVLQDPLVDEKDRHFWSFQPPTEPMVPQVRHSGQVRNLIDAFLLAQLEEKGLGFSEEAEPLTLLRRAYLDLVGFPPSPEEIQAYLSNSRSDAYEQMVDRLLDSPHHGERWARYWLDAVGYADSEGGVSTDSLRPFAYRYRDYVIRSLNQDKPYDRFLTEQIAGDELFDYRGNKIYTTEQLDWLIASGFLRMGPDSTYSTEQNNLSERFEVVATQVEILSSAVMGLTMGCARCHDHKYDPLPQRDFYRLSAILQTAYDPYDWLSPNLDCIGVGAHCDESNVRLLPLPEGKEHQEVREHNAPIQTEIDRLNQQLQKKRDDSREQILQERLAVFPEQVRQDLRTAGDEELERRTELQQYLLNRFQSTVTVTEQDLIDRFEGFADEVKEIKDKIKEEKGRLKDLPSIRALFDMGGAPTPVRILLRGEYTNPGPLVTPGVPSVLSKELAPYRTEKPAWSTQTAGRRLGLARWLTQPHHPLTARVMVNRLWQHHFGEGLVPTPGNFGRTGIPPSHPELLDWLARELVRKNWSLKAIHRLIMTSGAYRQTSRTTPQVRKLDPANRLLSRFPLLRLDADALRDSILKVAGRLDTTPFGPADLLEVREDGEVIEKPTSRGYRRSIYLTQRRSSPITLLEAFDAPLLVPNCLKRPESTVASQALHLENGELVRHSARYLAGRVIDEVGEDPGKQIERIYWMTVTRPPTAEERKLAESSLNELTREWRTHLETEVTAEPISYQAGWLALATLCHTYLNSAEFLYVN